MAAFSTIEIVFVLGVAATVGGVALAETGRARDDARASGAARYVATRLQQTRMEAIARGSATALRVSNGGSGYQFRIFLDGNHNGVLSADIAAGVDVPLQAIESVSEKFAAVEFGVLPNLPAVDSSSTPPGTDPIRLGSANSVTFTPLGTATPGSLYILGRGQAQFAVRIFGETGRTRVLRYHPQSGQWKPVSGV